MLTVIVPWLGSTSGVVTTLTAPSTSVSLFVMLPVIGVSSNPLAVSFATTGLSFTGVTVMKIVSFKQMLGDPLSQTLTTTVSFPVKFALGVYVNVPFVFTVMVPFLGSTSGVVTTLTAPSTSVSLFVMFPVIGVSSNPLAVSFATTGLSFTGVTVMKIVSFKQILGDPLSHTLTTTVSLPVKFALGV